MQQTEPTTDGQSPWEAQTSGEQESGGQRPELLVGAALLGGIVLAQVLKRLGSED